ncbi:unnamed protein product [Urochloa decumbens]|uniref:Exocyst subunit Exo70 family protein n=1 Tax=Urochloa decumbens TaxID=240449 RepID=A0ABC9DRY0_9POAL
MDGGRDGGNGPWSYGEENLRSYYYTLSSSCSSGTVSTAYASTGSRWWSSHSMEAAKQHLELENEDDGFRKSWEETKKRMNSVIQAFVGAPSANRSMKGGDMSALERWWFTELGVEWVPLLQATDDACGWKLEHEFDVRSWVVGALMEIVDTIGFATLLFPDRGLLPSICEEEEEEEPVTEQAIPDQFQFSGFIKQAMLKMLAFVDAIAAPNPRITTRRVLVIKNGLVASYDRLNALLDVRGALTKALPLIRLSSSTRRPLQRAIWRTMEEIWIRIMLSMKDSSSTQENPQGSSDIHKATRYVISYIRFLQSHYSSVAPIVYEETSLGNYAPQIGDVPPLDSLIAEMASLLQGKLTKMSDSFGDQSLKFSFLLNNSYFGREQPRQTLPFPKFSVAALSSKLQGYAKSYLQASWEPVLSCLFNPSPLCLGRKRNYFPLSNFESEFQKTYTTQKVWKVPDPELRSSLREHITKKIISGYVKYMEENYVTAIRVTVQELEEMLQELFEG